MPATAAQRVPETRDASRLFNSPDKQRLILCLLLAVTTLLLYNPVSRHDFVNYDDDQYIFENAHVRSGLTWNTVVWAFTTNDAGNWHPVTWLSHALDYDLFHLNPAGHHYTNLLLHAANGILLFLLLQWITGFSWRSLAVAAIFAVHPVNVESVAWVSERKNLLCTFFCLLAMGAYAWYVRRPGVKRYLSVVVSFALALMSKPMVITFPFVLLLLDYWPLCRIGAKRQTSAASSNAKQVLTTTWPALVLEKLPLIAMSAASAVVTMWAQQAGGAVRSVADYSLSVRLENALLSYIRYLGKAFWPTHLSPMYPHPGNTLPWWAITGSGVLLLLITAGVLKLQKHRYLAVGWFWYIGTLVPVIGIVQVGRQAMADRYAYIPIIGIIFALVWETTTVLEKRLSPKYLALLFLLVIAGLASVTRIQIGYWKDSVTLWCHALSVTDRNFVAQDNLGQALITQGKLTEAMQHFQAAANIDPTDPAAQMGIGVLQLRQGNRISSIEHFQNVLRLTSSPRLRAYAMTNLGSTYRQLGDYPRARENYEGALNIQPDTVIALLGLGLISDRTGEPVRATEYYSRAVTLEPSDVAYLLLARALERSGRNDGALSARQQAQTLSGNFDQTNELVNKLLAE